MKKNRRIVCMLMTAVMVLTLTACGKGNDTSKPSDSTQTTEPSQAQGTDKPQENNNSETSGDQSGNQLIVPAKLTGTLNLIEMDDRDSSILRGVRINGNCAGTIDDINGKEYSLTDVRCIFELNEWIESTRILTPNTICASGFSSTVMTMSITKPVNSQI